MSHPCFRVFWTVFTVGIVLTDLIILRLVIGSFAAFESYVGPFVNIKHKNFFKTLYLRPVFRFVVWWLFVVRNVDEEILDAYFVELMVFVISLFLDWWSSFCLICQNLSVLTLSVQFYPSNFPVQPFNRFLRKVLIATILEAVNCILTNRLIFQF